MKRRFEDKVKIGIRSSYVCNSGIRKMKRLRKYKSKEKRKKMDNEEVNLGLEEYFG